MQFKTEELREEFHSRSTLLQFMAQDFEQLSLSFGIDPTVTRVLETVTGSSGVHEAGRGIDFRDEHDKKRLYSDEQVRTILEVINKKFRRNDEYKTLKHHGFNGGPKHWHLQLAPLLSAYDIGDEVAVKDPQHQEPGSYTENDLDAQHEFSPKPSIPELQLKVLALLGLATLAGITLVSQCAWLS